MYSCHLCNIVIWQKKKVVLAMEIMNPVLLKRHSIRHPLTFKQQGSGVKQVTEWVKETLQVLSGAKVLRKLFLLCNTSLLGDKLFMLGRFAIPVFESITFLRYDTCWFSFT